MLLSGGQWLKIEGEVPDKDQQPYLYLFNHESLMDPFMLGGAIKHYVTAVGAEYQFSYPIWGTLAKRHGAIRKGISFIISPEGTRTTSGELGKFKKGPFHIALNTGVTIVPTALIGAYGAKKKTDWRLQPGILTVRFGELLMEKEYEGLKVEQLKDLVEEKIKVLINPQ